MRRIVTGNDNEGHSVVVSDGAAPRSTEFTTLPGFSDTLVWARARQRDRQVRDRHHPGGNLLCSWTGREPLTCPVLPAGHRSRAAGVRRQP